MPEKTKKDYLWIILFLIIFVNGFEAGGYQASLWNIGQTYDLSWTTMGLYASVELFATMLAPLILGSWADYNKKSKCIMILLGIQIVASGIILATKTDSLFIGGIFFLGLTTSALQFISIAALADAYPVSNKKKIGFMTSMYAFGALIAPLVVRFYLARGFSWRTLFILLFAGSIIAIFGMYKSGSEPREVSDYVDPKAESGGTFILGGILLLCVIMCIYVGFENGFAFFVDTMFTDILKNDSGKFALSLFWALMIPSRMLVGHFSKHANKILYVSVVAIPILTLLFSNTTSSTLALLICIPLGMASGAIYPCVLSIMLSFARKKTATATGMITTATGIGGFVFTALTGYISQLFGMRTGIGILGGFFIFSLISLLAITHLLRSKHLS